MKPELPIDDEISIWQDLSSQKSSQILEKLSVHNALQIVAAILLISSLYSVLSL